MAGDLPFDGMTKATWVPTIADLAAPTVAELTAAGAVPLEFLITPDGLSITSDTAAVDNSALASTFDTEQAGRRKPKIEITAKRKIDPDEDLAYTTLIYRAVGNLVVRRDKVATAAYAASDKVEIYPVECGEPNYAVPAPNTIQKFTVMMFCTSDPRTGSNPATVAAGT